MAIPVFGKEQYPLRKESGLSYTISDIYKHVPLHTHNHYELFIISEGTAYHLINDSVQTVKKGDLFFIRPNDMHSYSFFHSENFCVRNLGFSTQVLRNVSLFLEQEEKMDKLINSEMPAYVHLEGENFRKVLDAMDTAGNLVNESHPRHARYHAQCIIALLLVNNFFTYDENFENFAYKEIFFRVRFSEAASEYTASGNILFGASTGIFYFNPDSIGKSN